MRRSYSPVGRFHTAGSTSRRFTNGADPGAPLPVTVIEDSTGYVVDRTVTLTTRRGLAMQQRKHEKYKDDLAENAIAIGAATSIDAASVVLITVFMFVPWEVRVATSGPTATPSGFMPNS